MTNGLFTDRADSAFKTTTQYWRKQPVQNSPLIAQGSTSNSRLPAQSAELSSMMLPAALRYVIL